jgi:nucleotide-binding universal stress UspA family protein
LNVLVFYKPTPEGTAALSAAIHEASARGRDIIVYNAPQEDVRVDRASLNHAKAAANQQGIKFDVHSAADEKTPAEHLLEAADTGETDLVVIGIRTRSAVGKLLLGSVEQQILLECPVPVLSVKAGTS